MKTEISQHNDHSTVEEMMRVVVCERPGLLTLAERAKPVRRAGEVLIRIRRVGLCGSDYHILNGSQPYLTYPRVMGHELSGSVIEADTDSGFRADQTVCIMPYMSCGHCRACARGKPNCCRQLEVLGVHTDGGLAEFLSVPHQFVVNAEGLTLDQAAMVEFLSIGRHAVERGAIKSGDKVLVAGAGPIGMAVTLFAVRCGAQVAVLDHNDSRARFCVRELGAADAIALDDSTASAIAEITDGDGFDAVFDATGNPAAMEAGFSWVGHGGTYVLVSIVAADIKFNDPEFHKRETSLLASRNATVEDFEAVIEAIRSGEVPTDKLRTHGGPLDELPIAIASWTKTGSGLIKAIVELN